MQGEAYLDTHPPTIKGTQDLHQVPFMDILEMNQNPFTQQAPSMVILEVKCPLRQILMDVLETSLRKSISIPPTSVGTPLDEQALVTELGNVGNIYLAMMNYLHLICTLFYLKCKVLSLLRFIRYSLQSKH